MISDLPTSNRYCEYLTSSADRLYATKAYTPYVSTSSLYSHTIRQKKISHIKTAAGKLTENALSLTAGALLL